MPFTGGSLPVKEPSLAVEAVVAAAAEEDDVGVEDLSQQFSEVLSPFKSPAPKKAKKDGDGSSKDQALEITESQD